MTFPCRAWPMLIVVLMPLLLASGCGDDDDHPTDPQPLPGTVVVTVDPDDVAASWSLTGPDAGAWSGTGSLLLDGMDPGEYSIVWGEVAGYQTPEVTRQTLAEADTLTLVGRYAPPDAETSDQLMSSFLRAYSDANLERYRSILNADFRFITRDQAEFDRDRELEISARIFDGEVGDAGIAISGITVVYLTPLETWRPIAPGDPFFGGEPDGLSRAYDVRIDFRVAGQNLILQVRGVAIFYAKPLQEQGQIRYELLGIVDLTDGKTETSTWSSVKMMFD